MRFALATEGAASVDLFDVAGRLIRRLKRGNETTGRHEFTWRVDGVEPGVYFVRALLNGAEASQPIVIVR